ncbi:MAG: sigma-70 family RNA polymerase sigma factor [Planctomycetales bacterium]|nr:sigma-70 family RNA polymerase sigma factor [Planctomycetales bacterium]
MPSDRPHSRLCDISTRWSLVFQAHAESDDRSNDAQVLLMERYFGAVYRYLLSILQNETEADDLAQEFALRFLQGDFHRAEPSRGRFRDYVKTSLHNMLKDHFRSRNRNPCIAEPTSEICDPNFVYPENEFQARWRDELLEWTWQGLRELESEGRTPYYTALRWRAERPDATAAQLATDLSSQRGVAYSEANVRQILRRARERFAELLRAEVARSIESQSHEQLEEELAKLNLLQYCRRNS